MTDTALVFVAHPDDAEILMGGTICSLVHSGFAVHLVVSSMPTIPDIRKQEMKDAADVLGIHAHLLNHPGTWRVEDIKVYDLVQIYDGYINDLQPSLIFTHWQEDTHYDHSLVARAAIAATRRLPIDLFMFGPVNLHGALRNQFVADTFVDITQHIDSAVRAINCYKSQLSNRSYIEQFFAKSRFYGLHINVEFAEAFQCVSQQLRFTPRQYQSQ